MCEVGATAMERCRKRLEEELSCSICLQYFKVPVILDCGHIFCRACITKYWGESPTDTACPQCRETTQVKRLKPNMQLANVIEITKDMNHLLKHCFVSIEEAAHERKDQINGSLEFLRNERENIVLYKAKNKEESQDLLNQMQAERQKTTAAFGDLRQFLEDKEKLLLAQMDEVEKEIARRRDDHHTSLSAVLSSLDSLIGELEEKLKQSASELVQNVRNVLDRCPKEPFNNPVAFPVALQWKVHNFTDINPFLESLMKQFQDSLTDGLQLQQVNVTLDSNTAHDKIILSKDCKSLRLGPTHQDLPNNPERFDTWSFVLGNERMTSGRHFWEVAVGSEEEWSVGVARNDVKRKGKFDACPSEGIWVLGMWKGTYHIFNHPVYSTLPLAQKLKKIRVTLNCTAGRVAFFDANTGTHLHTYSNASLPGETLLPFFFISRGGTLTLCL